MTFKIDKKGMWISDSLEGHYFDLKLAEALAKYFKKNKQESIVDLGCGPGWYVRIFREKGLQSIGYDGNPFTEQISKQILDDGDCCEQLDLSKPFAFDHRPDALLSLEVGEHIPAKFEKNYIDNLARNVKKSIVLSWAVVGQGGSGHVNCRDNDYIILQMEKRGFEFDKISSQYLREQATLPWFKSTIMVFDNIEMLPRHKQLDQNGL